VFVVARGRRAKVVDRTEEETVASDDELFELVGRRLSERPGWSFQPSTTPGGVPSWCLDPGGEPVASVSVADATVIAYLPSEDREFRFAGVDELIEWLDAREGL